MRKGFTLIELLVVLTVVAILATLALYGLNRAQAAARDASRAQIMRGVQGSLASYYGANQAYPASADFCTLLNTGLAGYLSLPVDPGPGSKTVCGTCTAVCNSATYAYSPGGSNASYTLTLTKESGGSATFVSP